MQMKTETKAMALHSLSLIRNVFNENNRIEKSKEKQSHKIQNLHGSPKLGYVNGWRNQSHYLKKAYIIHCMIPSLYTAIQENLIHPKEQNEPQTFGLPALDSMKRPNCHLACE